MHVGSGEANYGVIDNLVQRDTNHELPIIHSSSLKGALREFFKDEWGENDDKLNFVFGADTIRNSSAKSGVGKFKFFEANLVVLPVRSNAKPFFRATSPFLLEEVNSKATNLGLINFDINPFGNVANSKGVPIIIEELKNCLLEDFPTIKGLSLKPGIDNSIGDNPALFHVDDFKSLAKHLPVIARNQLENGESKNLWYEEVVPRESRFVFFVSKPENTNTALSSDFDVKIQNNVVQIGGNASIGYGFTKIKKLS